MNAGQGARGEVGLEVISGFVAGVEADSCELVLFMLMVFPGCEGNHAGSATPEPILR